MQCDEIGVRVSRDEFVDFLNSVEGGQFFHIKGYKSQNDAGEVSDNPDDPNGISEVSDFWVRFGIKYENFKARDILFAKALLTGEKQVSIQVCHGVWVPDTMLADLFVPSKVQGLVWTKVTRKVTLEGGVVAKVETEGFVDLLDTVKFGNRKATGRSPVTLSYVLPSTHPLVLAAIGAADLQGTILQSLIKPRETTADYDKAARSFFSLDRKDGRKMWYLRDVALVSKVVRREGTFKFKANLPINAVKGAIESQCLLRSRYRQFILNESNFISINIAGQAVLVDKMDETIYFALPEDVKTMALSEVI